MTMTTMATVMPATMSSMVIVVVTVVVTPVLLRVVPILPFNRTHGLRSKRQRTKQQNASRQK